MSKHVSVRAIPAEGYQYRWGAGRPFSTEPVTLEVVDSEIPMAKPLDAAVFDVAAEVNRRLDNIRLRQEFLAALPKHQIHASQLAELLEDKQIVVIQDVAPPPAPARSEADVLRERLAAVEKQVAKR